jgi:hypothetical protein
MWLTNKRRFLRLNTKNTIPVTKKFKMVKVRGFKQPVRQWVTLRTSTKIKSKKYKDKNKYYTWLPQWLINFNWEWKGYLKTK